MTHPLVEILEGLPLSKTEKEVVKRFAAEPLGRAFLPVADILKTHRLKDESVELLIEGVQRHPTFTVARVVLARELLAKGLIADAWHCLEDSPSPLTGNALAQKLRFKLALLLDLEHVVKASVQHLRVQQMLDSEVKKLIHLIELADLSEAKKALTDDFTQKGIDLVFPEQAKLNTIHEDVMEQDVINDINSATSASHVALEEETLDTAANFHVMPLDEIFNPSDMTAQPKILSERISRGIELDSTTLAEIYARQGHYSKALSIYRRMLQSSPKNDMLRRKVQELADLDRKSQEQDLSVDSQIVDNMETISIIDRQVSFYESLLKALDSK